MNWFTKQVPSSALVARLDNGDVDAARDYLQRFRDNAAVEEWRILQALTLVALDDRGQA